jgi:hypothetical protein
MRTCASSQLARMLSLNSKESLLICLKSYFDGSHQGKSWEDCSAIALAGFAAGDDVIAQFESDYKAVLDDDRHRPAAPYLHMSKLRSESGNSPFSTAHGWNDERRTRLVRDVLELLRTLDKARSALFVCSVEPLAIQNLHVLSPKPVPSPVRICVHWCPHYVMRWWSKEFPGIISECHYFFDWNEPFLADFQRLRSSIMGNQFEIGGNRETWSLLKHVTQTSMIEETPLQIADMLAWSTVRQRTNRQDKFLSGLAVEVKKAIRISKWVHVTGSNATEWCEHVPID